MLGKKFRLRFRVTHKVFEELLRECVREREGGAWWRFPGFNPDGSQLLQQADASGRYGPHIALKLMAALRVLGRASCFDDMTEMSGIQEEALRTFFHEFCAHMAGELFPVWCAMPNKDEVIKSITAQCLIRSLQIARITAVYARLGLPGCVGSTDAVHIPWLRCPTGLRSWFVGKEGFPTTAYNVTCDHGKRIWGSTDGNPGARNDKTISWFDDFLLTIKTSSLFTHATFNLFSALGAEYAVQGLYLICDGGYHSWRILQCPDKCSANVDNARWSKWIESVRKDVECLFGILKGRFRILKVPMPFRTKQQVQLFYSVNRVLIP